MRIERKAQTSGEFKYPGRLGRWLAGLVSVFLKIKKFNCLDGFDTVIKILYPAAVRDKFSEWDGWGEEI